MEKNKKYVVGYVPATTRTVTPIEFTGGSEVEPIIRPIIVSSSGQIRFQEIIALNTSGNAQTLSTDSFDVNPVTGSNCFLSVNGQVFYPADGASEVATKAFYIISSDGSTVRTIGTYQAGDILKWNGTFAGFDIETSDILKLAYEI